MKTRRQFLGKFALFSFAVSAMLAIMGSLKMLIPAIRNNKKIMKLKTPNEYPLNSFTFVPEAKVYIIRERRGIKALSALCTHLGCTLIKTDIGFHCPCHGSSYDKHGNVTAGPAPANLAWFELSQNLKGNLIVNKDKKTNNEYFYSLL